MIGRVKEKKTFKTNHIIPQTLVRKDHFLMSKDIKKKGEALTDCMIPS